MFTMPNWCIPTINKNHDLHFQKLIDNKTKPPGSLGKLETLAMQIARIQLSETPHSELQINQPTMLIFAADHGIANHPISIAPPEVTQQMVLNFLAGGAAINCFCRLHQIDLNVIDAGMLKPLNQTHSNYFEQRLGPSTADISVAPAMSITDVERGLIAGAKLVQHPKFKDSNVVSFGEMGIGNTSSAAALLCAYTGARAGEVVGRGTGIDDTQLTTKIALVDKALQRTRKMPESKTKNPCYLLASLGGFEIIQMIGAMLASAEQKKLIVVDGFIVTIAALYACAIAPRARHYMVFAHEGAERSHQLALKELNAEPLLDLGLRLGEGTGAALALPLLRTAAAFFNEMATFESANVNV